MANGFTELHHTRIAGITRFLGIEAGLHGVQDLVRCGKIRFTDTQGQDPFDLSRNIEELADSRGFDGFDISRCFVIPIHNTTPPSL